MELQHSESQRPEPLILISLDGFRPDYMERAHTPSLDRLAEGGVRAERMIPVFPSKTFPNHYSIVTGLYPENHGIVGNTMYDPVFDADFSLGNRKAVEDGRWWEGEPIWVTAQRQGLRSGTVFWPGSEAVIGGARPNYWLRFDQDMPHRRRVDQLLEWLDLPTGERPTLFTLYFSDVDSAGHRHGPDSAEVEQAVEKVDASIGLLLEGLRVRGLLEKAHILVVADHGMAALSPDRVIYLDDYVSPRTAGIVTWSPLLGLRPKPEDLEQIYEALSGAHPHLQIYRREELPERFRHRAHRRIPPLLGVVDEGWTVTTRNRLTLTPRLARGGAHGYDNQLPSMGALFIATGPRFRRGETVAPFENVHLYSLMCHLLDIEPAATDGSLNAVSELLLSDSP